MSQFFLSLNFGVGCYCFLLFCPIEVSIFTVIRHISLFSFMTSALVSCLESPVLPQGWKLFRLPTFLIVLLHFIFHS